MALTEDQIKDLEETFELFDKDKDGVLTFEECAIFIRSLGGNPTKTKIKEIFNSFQNQGDDDDTVSFEEFKTWMINNGQECIAENAAHEIMEAFKVFDTDGKGFVTKEKFEQIMSGCGEEPLTSDEMTALFNEIDKNGDGLIYYEEYLKSRLEDNGHEDTLEDESLKELEQD